MTADPTAPAGLQMELRRAAARGHADHGWLDSHHSFSFGGYHDPRFMGFGALRVINEDRVLGGQGFGTHPHRDMEIVSYVIDGALAHRDTLGTGSIIRPGELQLMRAGRGIAHSEMNAHPSDPVHFLQIWILPARAGTQPGYQQQAFPPAPGLTRLASPDGSGGTLQIDQDIELWRLLLDPGAAARHRLARGRAWVQVVKGVVDVEGARLYPGDGLAVTGAAGRELGLRAPDGDAAAGPVEALVFDLR
jgi:redox-sensitive bicupin YhaK (pirin superfamily)